MHTVLTFSLPMSSYMDAPDIVDDMNDWMEASGISGWGIAHQTLLEKGHIEILFRFTLQEDAVIFYMYWSSRVGTDWNII